MTWAVFGSSMFAYCSRSSVGHFRATLIRNCDLISVLPLVTMSTIGVIGDPKLLKRNARRIGFEPQTTTVSKQRLVTLQPNNTRHFTFDTVLPDQFGAGRAITDPLLE